MKKVGFIGLGTMGRFMATNLAKAGYEMYVYDLNPEACKKLEALGAKVMDSSASVAESSEAVITMLPAPADVEAAYLGKGGVLEGAHAGLIAIDSSSIDPDTSRRVATAAAKVGVRMIDAPVGGSPASAKEGSLVMLVGGDKAVMEEVRPILETVGSEVLHCGEVGAGEAVKLCNNLTTNLIGLSFVEAFTVAREYGVNEDMLQSVLTTNIPKNVPGLIGLTRAKNYEIGFRATLMHKDLKLVLGMAEKCGIGLPFTALAKEMFQMAIKRGWGNGNSIVLGRFYNKEEVQ